jgi:hypothetical protein
VWLTQRDPTGFLAQFLAIGLTSIVSIPLLASHTELSGAAAPLSVSLVLGAFVFGAAMQLADGCGSGTLYKAGLGHPVSLAVFPAFVVGSFLGAAHQDAWLSLGALPAVSLTDVLGAHATVLLQLAVLAAIATLLWSKRRTTTSRWQGRGVYVGAVLLAVFAIANLIVAGQPWGIVYGLGLWGAKLVSSGRGRPVRQRVLGPRGTSRRRSPAAARRRHLGDQPGPAAGQLRCSRWRPARRLPVGGRRWRRPVGRG